MNKAKPTTAKQGRPPASESEGRRERILDSALTLFAGHGIAGTTIAQIAKSSEVTSAMVHYYFGNRKGLLDAIAAERLAPAIEYIWAGVSEEALAEPRRIVTEFVDRLLETVEEMPQLPQLWSREMLNPGGLLRGRLLALVPLERLATVISAFSRAQQEGTVNPLISPSFAMTSIMAVVMLPITAWDMLGKIPIMPALDKEALRRHALALLLDGLCPKKSLEEQQ